MKKLLSKLINKLFKKQKEEKQKVETKKEEEPKITFYLNDEPLMEIGTEGIFMNPKINDLPKETLDIVQQRMKEEITHKVLINKQKEKLFHEGNVYVFSRKLFKKHNKKDKHWSKKINGREIIFNDKFSAGTTVFKNGTVLVNREWCKCIQNNISRRKNK